MSKFITYRNVMIFVLLLVTSAFFLSGCSLDEESEQITVTDMVGDSVTMKVNPTNVAVIARAAADMMIGFGLGDYVDGMYYSILDNPWVTVLYPAASNFHSYDYDESAELFLSREVDLVFAPEKHIAEKLRNAGVNAITVSLYGTPNYDSYLYTLSNIIKQIWPLSQQVIELWQGELEEALSEVSNAIDEANLSRRSVYYVRGDKDRGIGYTDTGFSLLETIYSTYFNMDYIGSTFTTNRPSAEEIMQRDPDVIVVGGIYQNKLLNDIQNDEPYNLLSAVSNNAIYNIPISFVMWEQNSIVLPLFVYDQANKLYSSLFNFDIETLTRESFERYFSITLTTQQIQYMLQGLGPQGTVMYE